MSFNDCLDVEIDELLDYIDFDLIRNPIEDDPKIDEYFEE